MPPGLRHSQQVVERGADTPPLDLHVFALDTEGRGSGKALSAEGRHPGLVWIHGGGYIIGSASDAGRILHWVRAGYVVIAPEYRLAPEHPFPAGLQDCMAGLEETVRRAADLGLDADRLVVAGGSAGGGGGGLAAALALRCRDVGIKAIRHLVLIAPMVDDTTVPPADVHLAVWGGAANRLGWDAYLHGLDHSGLPASYAAVARATDFSGLPPTTITVGTADLFCNEAIELASRLLRSGVPVDLHVYAGLPHGFESLAPNSSQSRVLERDIFESIDRAATLRESQGAG
ncbi:MAG TPA: alpha/beta hydrolase fold domain-containing protein [Streptosporangiaceae bacterium]|nr:alpha/beta hydrolase fold domain-containing protein [Streptosporangiaceae bacterium]